MPCTLSGCASPGHLQPMPVRHASLQPKHVPWHTVAGRENLRYLSPSRTKRACLTSAIHGWPCRARQRAKSEAAAAKAAAEAAKQTPASLLTGVVAPPHHWAPLADRAALLEMHWLLPLNGAGAAFRALRLACLLKDTTAL